jgi:hypothetical protein
MALPNLPYAQMIDVAQHGSPALLNAVGRAFGLGEAETRALQSGKIPGWFWLTLGVGAGLWAGIQVHKRWPDKIPAWAMGR